MNTFNNKNVNVNNAINANVIEGNVTQTYHEKKPDCINLVLEGEKVHLKHITKSKYERQQNSFKYGIGASLIIPSFHLLGTAITTLQGFIWSAQISAILLLLCILVTFILSTDYIDIRFRKINNKKDGLHWIDQHCFIEENKAGYDFYRFEANCIYPNCTGKIIPHVAPQRTQIRHFSAWAVCSLCGKEHSYGVDSLGNATKFNVDWQPLEKKS
ncbi:hypothetical protein [Vibrio coralliilyticus]|uniref:hypothetical protein n=1 Tax=Vibrio coralliilyticus TaxID=190893 RepID=UPI001560E8ED|nr:hypothetical protein [Vibrio coralliilyticus]NRF28913.1 hypothetical protein [Vibrio coralliilyticus]NRF50836.1 hypothetical protein [Vibrio coralliilyticus]NRG05195.1 hypothetical protein [Vibrio coralliilyticus]